MQDINLYHLLKFYAKNWIWIVSLVIFGLISGFIYSSYIQTPMYKSDATLLLVRSATSSDNTTQNVTRINNYIELLKSRRVLEPVVEKQNNNMTYDDLINSIEVSSDKDTEVIKLSIASKDPKVSKELVEGAVSSFKEQVSKIYKADNVSVVDSANVATDPFNIHKEISIALFAASCLLLSLIVLFFLYDYQSTEDKSVSDANVVKPTEDIQVQETGVNNIDTVVIETPKTENSPTISSPTVNTINTVQPARYSYTRERQIRR